MLDDPAKPPRFPFVAVLVVAFLFLLAVCLPIALNRRPRIEHNEGAAWLCLRLYVYAQNKFHENDYYGKGRFTYANPLDGKGFPDLHQIGGPGSGGKALGFLHRRIAEATTPERAFKGYYFVDITRGADGAPWDYEAESSRGARRVNSTQVVS